MVSTAASKGLRMCVPEMQGAPEPEAPAESEPVRPPCIPLDPATSCTFSVCSKALSHTGASDVRVQNCMTKFQLPSGGLPK